MPGFFQRFTESAERWPSNVAIEVQPVHGPIESWTYAQLRLRAESVGRWLQQRSPEAFAGARCALLAANGPRWVAAYLGVLAAGGIAVPLDTAFHPDQVAKLLRDSGSSLLFTDGRHLATAQAARELLPDLPIEIVVLDAGASSASSPSPAAPQTATSLDEIFSAGPGGFSAAPVAEESVAVILYTSGTTSDPKGVMLTHANLRAEADSVFKFLQVGPSDAILGVLPLFHALAQMANLLLPFAAGMRVVYLETLNTTELLRGLRERHITFFCCVPQFFYLIHERVMKQVSERPRVQRILFSVLLWLSGGLRKLGINAGKIFFRQVHTLLGAEMRYLITGGSRFDVHIARDLHALGFDILQAYGLTETSGGAVATPPRDNVLGSVGQPLPGMEVKIVPVKAAGEPSQSADGQSSGEIAIRGGVVMNGYYNRPQATAEVLRDGWLFSGDLGRLDRRGNLFITGRQKDVIVLSSGKNIYPEEIEAHYLQSPFIKELCVLGVESRGGEPLGERLHAVVVPNFDVLRERKIVNTSQVIRFDIENLSAQLPSTKRILSYDLWQHELPRTSTRKLKRFEIQQQVAAQPSSPGAGQQAETSAPKTLSPEDQLWLAQPEVERSLAIIRGHTKTSTDKSRAAVNHPDDNLELDLGFDSMERVELLVALEHELNSQVEDSVVSQVYTVRELVEAVRAGINAAGKGKAGRAGWDALLATENDGPELAAISKPRRLNALAWFAASRIWRVVAAVLFRMRVEGLEKLPAGGPFIIAPNHQSYFDGLALVSVLPWRTFKDLFFVGTSEIFSSGIWRLLARSMRLIAVDPDANLVPAMRAGAYGLRRGRILVLYPEGERSIDGTPKVFRKGAAILASHLKVPIVPVAMAGFYESWPRGKSFQKFARWHIRFGDALAPGSPGADSEAVYQQVTAQLRARVVEMWQEIRETKPAPARPLEIR